MSAGGAPTRAAARHADSTDPLAHFRARFAIPDPDVCYLDGNSLGRPPLAAGDATRRVLETWGVELVEAWERWIDRPLEVGDLLAPLLGAGLGQVVVGESTTVALHQAVTATMRARPDRSRIIALAGDFPTDRYVVTGVAGPDHVRWAATPTADAVDALIDDTVAAVVMSAVHFETAAIAEVAAITAVAHAAGCLAIWDCSHAAGAVPLALDDDGVDVAVGCTYKYLHGGPGAPAWTYVARRHHDTLRPSVQGWFAQRDQFSMGPTFDPLPGPAGWRAGTPGILGLEVAAAGIATVTSAGVDAVRAKSITLGETIVDAHDAWFTDLGFELASPRDPSARGGHVALRHPHAGAIVRAARHEKVVVDLRAPDLVRLGPGPLATSHEELTSGLERLRDLVAAGRHHDAPPPTGRVT